MSIMYRDELRYNCRRVFSDKTSIMDCTAGEKYFEIKLTNDAFHDGKLMAREELIIEVIGLRNPRMMRREVLFILSSFNEERQMIDISTFDKNMMTQMTTPG